MSTGVFGEDRAAEYFGLRGRLPIATDVFVAISETFARLRARHGAKLLRFGAVSALNVILGQTLLYGAQLIAGWPPVVSNVFAVSVGAIPAYILSRYWVWEKRGRSHLWREVVPFWTLALVGFVLSTTAVWWIDTRYEASPIMVNLTNLAAFGAVWTVKFFILDRILFRPEEAGAPL